jgi:CBS domain-containing protein
LAAEACREVVIQRNMRELVDMLVADVDTLPGEAAERISIQRIAARERDKLASEVMTPMPTIRIDKTIRQAAARLVESNSPILAVLSVDGDLAGVLTEWDITRGIADGSQDDRPLDQIMSTDVISARPDDTILDVIRLLEYHEVSAIPVVDAGCVQGMVTADLLARRSLLGLLLSERL